MAVPVIQVHPVNGPDIVLMSPDLSLTRSLGLSNDNILTLDDVPITTASYALYAETASYSISASHAIFADTSSNSNFASTSSFVEFSNVANKPTLVSSSAQINTGSFTGSFFGTFVGTASWANNSRTASYVTFDNVANKPALVSSSFQVLSGSGVYSSSAQITFPATTSYAIFAETSSRATLANSASYVEFANIANKPTLVSSSAQINTGSFTGSFTGVLVGTSSWAIQAVTASHALTALTASFVATSSWSIRSISSSYADTASFVSTASWARNAITASYFSGSITNAISSSYALSASYAVTASFAVTASYTATASYVNPRTIGDHGSSFVIRTGSLTVTTANTWQSVPYEHNVFTDSVDWTYSSGGTVLTCSTAGAYNIDAVMYLQKTGGTAAVGAMRILKNSSEISGSYGAYTFASNNTAIPILVHVRETFAANDTLTIQLTGTSTTIQAAPPPTAGTPVTRPTSTLRVHPSA